MENIAQADASRLLSQQVAAGRYFFLTLAPDRRHPLTLAMGGREHCNADYRMRRASFPYHVIEYVKAGSGEVRLDGMRHELRPGVVFSYGPSTRYEIEAAPGAPMLKYFLAIGGKGVADRLRASGIAVGAARELAAHAEVTTVFEDLVREGQRSGGLASKICATLLELLLLKIQDSATLTGARTDPARAAFLRCKALVDAEAERLSGLDEIARWAGVEASSVCRWFRRYQGTSPYQYLVRRKMNLAAEYLIESGGLVKEAAQRVGFADPFHFSRAFKAVHGVPPSKLLRAAEQASP